MEPTDFLAATARDGAGFVDACEAAGLTVPVASCPGWSVADLLWHLAEVHHFWATIVGDQRDTWEGYEAPARPADDELPAFYRAGLAATLAVLRAAEPSAPNWTWSNDHSAGFVIRRMAQETAVHRWDAEHAAGHDWAIDAGLASDGIDEFLYHFRGDGTDGGQPVGGSVHLHCTDVAGEWTVRPLADGGSEVTREHAKGDCALRGTANDLLLVLWRRLPLSAADVVGDAGVAARFVADPSLE
jgi:uncharacterized protein (TIGR03083 family)